MFDFELTEEQKALIETARRFARERIIPIAAAVRPRVAVPAEVFEEAWKIGLVNPTLPAEYGGPGLSDLDSTLHHRGARVRLQRHPDEHDREHARPDADQARRHRGAEEEVPRLARAASRSSRATRRPSRAPGATSPGCRRRATKDGDGGYVLNGTKAWITNATLASFYVIFATENPALRHKGIGAFIVAPRRRRASSVGKHEDKLGQRASDTRGRHARGRARPRRRRCSRRPGQGFKLAMETFNQTRPDIGAIAVGAHAPLPRRVRRLREGAQDVRRARSRSTSSCRR